MGKQVAGRGRWWEPGDAQGTSMGGGNGGSIGSENSEGRGGGGAVSNWAGDMEVMASGTSVGDEGDRRRRWGVGCGSRYGSLGYYVYTTELIRNRPDASGGRVGCTGGRWVGCRAGTGDVNGGIATLLIAPSSRVDMTRRFVLASGTGVGAIGAASMGPAVTTGTRSGFLVGGRCSWGFGGGSTKIAELE